MNPRKALDQTIKHFELKAKDLAELGGITEYELSKYRRGHKDMVSTTVFRIIKALPESARFYFYSLCAQPDKSPDECKAS